MEYSRWGVAGGLVAVSLISCAPKTAEDGLKEANDLYIAQR
jgi:hypothetical protein